MIDAETAFERPVRRPAKPRRITPGTRRITVISAMSGGRAERILQLIAHPQDSDQPTNRREFGPWEDGICVGSVLFGGQRIPVTLKLGVEEGLHLTDSTGLRWSPRSDTADTGSHRITVGERAMASDRSIANDVVGTWVFHGFDWWDTAGRQHYWPYGDGGRPPEHFLIVDGAQRRMTLQRIMELGAVRSAHVGQWDAPYTTVAAACGMPVLLHEFQESGRAKDFNVCVFRDTPTSEAPDRVWGGHCAWVTAARRVLGRDTQFGDIADASASPFAFHLHATKRIFPMCTLASTFVLQKVSVDALTKILSCVAEVDPERFFRLVDVQGRAHSFKAVDARWLHFEDGHRFERARAAESVVSTFQYLRDVECNPASPSPPGPFVVPDTHVYVVLMTALTLRNSESHHLGGSDMHRYITQGLDGMRHAVRNERLFVELCPHLQAPARVHLHIYPSARLALRGVSQYAFDPSRFDPSRWLTRELTT